MMGPSPTVGEDGNQDTQSGDHPKRGTEDKLFEESQGRELSVDTQSTNTGPARVEVDDRMTNAGRERRG